uniref:Putative gamma-glutamylcyclotransferase n=1 Tax=Aegilops tauschii subsp. strangulata TaxID=200361 RepID=A0A453NA39_AEGTS
QRVRLRHPDGGGGRARPPRPRPAVLPRAPPQPRLSIRGRVYPAILPVDGSKVPGKVWQGITDRELDVLDIFEDEEYVRETVGISLAVSPFAGLGLCSSRW